MTSLTKVIFILCVFISCFGYAANDNDKNSSNKMERPQRPSFTSIDANGNGDIDFDEFSLQALPHGDHQSVFETIDSNNDGVIEQDEFDNHRPPRAKSRKERNND